ncbi:Disease resistance protein (NBS class) family [Raphanus sativus]|uniref:Probable disease resistance protein At1g58390 isoform X1 n=1 Tax=Raphanus sativus TaxID=3726 RepID=A0A9W3C320_RAPSA|nr:probable disease resistance protein At1g58390 isoform X1 [Raphanus sativus]KAJ4887867.1 Disease resistance protein (NBS class) family [Raphanus sativus]
MAEVAVALLPFAVERLWNLLVREAERFQGVEEQFEGLKKDVDMLRCFLKDAEAKKHASEMVKKTIKDIKEIVYDAEDVVETFLLKKELKESSSSSVKRFACVTITRMGLGSDMRTICKRISEVIRDMQNLGVQKVIVDDEHMQALQVREREMRQTFSRDDEEQPFVGIERNVEKLVGYLVEEDSSQVVSITGMGGLGKTTLARQVFNHKKIKSHFPALAWVCVSQQFERKCVWQTILRQLRPECDVSKMMEDELLEKIVRVLETQKALIVIDDIWREGDWDLIKPVFLPKKGCKVLLTSRNEEVALHAGEQCDPIKLECLTFDESWDLFQRIAFPIKDTSEFKIEEDMNELGIEMLKHCGGLPLAIKVLGGMLRKKYTLQQWKTIRENIKAPIFRGSGTDERNINKEVYDVLYLSFEELPAYLKYCFLYLASFPEDYAIPVENLSYYWAAEGMLRPMDFDGASIREVADICIEELVKRNMVISKRDIDTSRFETLQLHDMMREVCLRKAEEENFVQTIDTSIANSKSPCKSRRLALTGWHQEPPFNVDMEVKNPSLRTLLLIGNGEWKVTSLFFPRHKLMRVLDLPWVEFEGGKVPSSIGKLIHLRYLSLKRSHATRLPSSMRNLKKLLYLNLDVIGEVYMPNILKEMRELTFLSLPQILHDKTNLELGNLVKLETLKYFCTKHGRVTDLHGMTRLRSLFIYIMDERYTMETLSSSLSKLSHLESLTIDSRGRFYRPTNDDEKGFVWDFVNLKQLKLEIYMPRLPDAQRFPSHLTTISLRQCRLKEDPMPILEKLLHLKEIELWNASFIGRRMDCSRHGFPQLQKLLFKGLDEWEEWILEEGSMPLLHTLNITFCPNLKELPDGLRFITSLKNLTVEYSSAKLSVRYFPFRLTTISLTKCCLEENLMPVLERLLHLKIMYLGKGSLYGKRLVCSRDGFPQLENLDFKGIDEWEEWIVEEGSMPLLHTLDIKGCPNLKELPDGLRFITNLEHLSVDDMGDEFNLRLSEGYLPSHLTTISLSGCPFTEDPMPILEKLFHLKKITLGDRSFCGRRMICSKDGFPQLQKLTFSGLEDWEEWIVEEGSMPLLHTLDILVCPKLKELPDGLQFIASLKSVTCYGMEKRWEKRLWKGGKDYYKVQHIPSVKFISE